MKRILIVDDNTEFLQTLSTVLSGDFDTIKAKGVKEALDILQEITVDAVCSDFNMEDGTGLDLLEIIRQQGLKTPFLLMSGDDSRAFVVRPMRLGFRQHGRALLSKTMF